MLYDISDKEFTLIVKESYFYSDILRRWGYNCVTNYRPVKKRIKILN